MLGINLIRKALKKKEHSEQNTLGRYIIYLTRCIDVLRNQDLYLYNNDIKQALYLELVPGKKIKIRRASTFKNILFGLKLSIYTLVKYFSILQPIIKDKVLFIAFSKKSSESEKHTLQKLFSEKSEWPQRIFWLDLYKLCARPPLSQLLKFISVVLDPRLFVGTQSTVTRMLIVTLYISFWLNQGRRRDILLIDLHSAGYLSARVLEKAHSVRHYFGEGSLNILWRYGYYKRVKIIICSKAQREEIEYWSNRYGPFFQKQRLVSEYISIATFPTNEFFQDTLLDIMLLSEGWWARTEDGMRSTIETFGDVNRDLYSRFLEVLFWIIEYIDNNRALRFGVKLHPHEVQLFNAGYFPPYLPLLEKHGVNLVVKEHVPPHYSKIGVCIMSSSFYERLGSGYIAFSRSKNINFSLSSSVGKFFYDSQISPSIRDYVFDTKQEFFKLLDDSTLEMKRPTENIGV